MFGWIQKWALKTKFTEIPLPISYQDKPMMVLVARDEALIVTSFIAANMSLYDRFLKELHQAFTTLESSQGKTNEEEASRIILLNELRHKYQGIFEALDQVDEEVSGEENAPE